MKNLHTNIDLSSDRILQIEVIDNPIKIHSNAEDFSTSADWASHSKRIREDIKNENGIRRSSLAGVEGILSSDEASEDAVFDFVLNWARTSKSGGDMFEDGR